LEFEAEKIISFIFKRSGKIQLEKSEFYLTLSVDLKWFSPDIAKNFMRYVIKQNLLKEINNLLEPNFDINNISIPFGYSPHLDSYKVHDIKNEEKIIDITDIILKKLNYTSSEEKEITNNIVNISNEKNIYSNVASLLVFRGLNIKLSDYIKFAENQIIIE